MTVYQDFPPRGLRALAAARHIGLGRTKFLELVADGRLPQPIKIDGARVWDRLELEAAFAAFSGASVPSSQGGKNEWDVLCA